MLEIKKHTQTHIKRKGQSSSGSRLTIWFGFWLLGGGSAASRKWVDVVGWKEANGTGAYIVATPPGWIRFAQHTNHIVHFEANFIFTFRMESIQRNDSFCNKKNQLKLFLKGFTNIIPISASSEAFFRPESGVDLADEPAEPADPASDAPETAPSGLTYEAGNQPTCFFLPFACSSPSHQPLAIFFRTWINWPASRESCSAPVAV